MQGAVHSRINFLWKVRQEVFLCYSMLQGRAGIPALINITRLFCVFLLYNHKLLSAEKDNGE